MGFDYSTRGMPPQQRATINQRKRDEELRRRENEKQKRYKTTNQNSCEAHERLGDHERVIFKNDGNSILDLRVSGTALVNDPCGLKELNIHEWLCKTGSKFVGEVKEYMVLTITSNDVRDGKLITSWKNLHKE